MPSGARSVGAPFWPSFGQGGVVPADHPTRCGCPILSPHLGKAGKHHPRVAHNCLWVPHPFPSFGKGWETSLSGAPFYRLPLAIGRGRTSGSSWAGRYIFCGTFRRRPLKAAPRTLSGTPLCGVRTFLCPPAQPGHAPSVRRPAATVRPSS